MRDDIEWFLGLRSADRLIELDFGISPLVRFGWNKPVHPKLQAIIARDDDIYRTTLENFLQLSQSFLKIDLAAINDFEPHWINDWIPAFDAISLYAYVVQRNPRTFFEIGSGTSTKFVRRAIKDHGLRTRIVSIDPSPRSEIDALCDKIIRTRLEDSDLSLLSALTDEDILFFDGSHRAFQNSDATVFFTDVLPELQSGLLVGIHDIFLPHDYPEDWLKRFYSEQYLLACWLLAGQALKIELPLFYCTKTPALHNIFADIWSSPRLHGAITFGGIFWFSRQRADHARRGE